VIFRSAGLEVRYLDHLRVWYHGRERALGGLLRYHPEKAAELHARDRVHTYGSFYIADLPA
jgi:S-adenosylmethionine-diacylglycerol 3-amino-3-carboxypropyl transferase